MSELLDATIENLTNPYEHSLALGTGRCLSLAFDEALDIQNDREYRSAAEHLRRLSAMKSDIQEKLDPFIASANEAHKSATKRRREYLKPVEQGIENLKTSMLEYEETRLDGAFEGIELPLPQIGGLVRKSTWKGTVLDPVALLRFIADNCVERPHLLKMVRFDAAELNRQASALRGAMSDQIPGVEAREVKSLISRS